MISTPVAGVPMVRACHAAVPLLQQLRQLDEQQAILTEDW